MVRTSRKIPTDWTKYEPIGATIGGSRIFAFKTPLYPELQNRISKECRFTTLDLVQKLASFDRSLGLVINCNNTRRYFCKKDLEGLGIDYKEIACPGRGFLYRMDVVKLFLKSVDDFLEQNNDNDLLIGVNCSNGVNRSGYLICNYLISRLGWSSHDALNAFENARGYPIERGSYVQALHKADREHRSKMMPLELDKNEYDEMGNTVLPMRTSNLVMADEFNSQLTAQMMQQFFNIEQEFKQVAETTATHSSADSSPAFYSSLGTHAVLSTQKSRNVASVAQSSQQTKPRHEKSDKTFNQGTSSSNLEQPNIADEDTEIGDAECISDDEFDDSLSPNIDFESMGRIDAKEATSKSQLRRQRRQKREKMFAVMKRGRFWEINEMRKEMHD